MDGMPIQQESNIMQANIHMFNNEFGLQQVQTGMEGRCERYLYTRQEGCHKKRGDIPGPTGMSMDTKGICRVIWTQEQREWQHDY